MLITNEMFNDIQRSQAVEDTHERRCAEFEPPPLQTVFATSICACASSSVSGCPAFTLALAVCVGVRDGSQKSGSLAFIRSACSSSSFLSAACSACSCRADTVEAEKVNDADDDSEGCFRLEPVSLKG